MRKSLFLSIVIILFSNSIVGAQSQEPVKLGYTFKIGDTRNYQLKLDGDIAVEINTGNGTSLPKSTAKIKGNFLYVQEVKSFDQNSGIAKIDVTYGKSTMDTLMGGNVIPSSDVSALTGKVAKLSVASDGKIQSFEMPKGLPASVPNADFSKFFIEFPTHNCYCVSFLNCKISFFVFFS